MRYRVSMFLWLLGLLVLALGACSLDGEDDLAPPREDWIPGTWSGGATRTGTMCRSTYNRPCEGRIRFVRKDVNRFVLGPDSVGFREFSYIRVNGDDASESWKREDSLLYWLSADTLYLKTRKYRYLDGETTPWEEDTAITAFAVGFSGPNLILRNYVMSDTGTGWTLDFRLSRSR